MEQKEFSLVWMRGAQQMLLVPCPNHVGITSPVSTLTTCHLHKHSDSTPRLSLAKGEALGLSREQAGLLEEFRLVSRTGIEI